MFQGVQSSDIETPIEYALKAGSQHCKHPPIVHHLVKSRHQGEKLLQSRQPATGYDILGTFPD